MFAVPRRYELLLQCIAVGALVTEWVRRRVR
jgi:hypothetical protein